MEVKIQSLIVGAGLSGAVAARVLADNGCSVLLIDSKNYIGGNCYDYHDNSIIVHKHGPHIFHTNSKFIWEFISRFTKWYPYQHKALGLVDGQFIPIPFNLNSLRMVFTNAMANRIENKLMQA